MTKYLWAALLALTIALCGALYAAHSTRETLTATRVQVEGLSSRLGTLEKRHKDMVAGVQSLMTRSQQHDRDLKAAFQSHPDWSAAPVPPAVRDRLCEYVECTPD